MVLLLYSYLLLPVITHTIKLKRMTGNFKFIIFFEFVLDWGEIGIDGDITN